MAGFYEERLQDFLSTHTSLDIPPLSCQIGDDKVVFDLFISNDLSQTEKLDRIFRGLSKELQENDKRDILYSVRFLGDGSPFEFRAYYTLYQIPEGKTKEVYKQFPGSHIILIGYAEDNQ